MPIRFRCVYCGQLLSIATRKVGSTVDCPKCSHPNVVPEKDQTATEEKKARSESKVGKAFESKKFDRWLGRDVPPDEGSDYPEASGGSGSGDVEAISDVLEAHPSGSESESAVEEPWRREPEGLPASRSSESSEVVAFGAGAAVPLAILVVFLLLVAFGLGVLVGRYAWPASGVESPSTAPAAVEQPAADEKSLLAEAAAAHRAALTGRVTYSRGPEAGSAADVGATVIALRHDSHPASDNKIPFVGLRPADENHPEAVQRLSDYGGGFAVVGADGAFRLASLQPGGYLLLIVSKHIVDNDGPTVTKVDEQRLAKYFADVRGLVGRRAFHIRDCALVEGKPPAPIEYEFRDKSTLAAERASTEK